MLNSLMAKYKNADENSRTVLLNVISAFLIKGGALIVTLLTTPAYIRYFNNNSALGLWFTLLSVITWVLNFDLGIGNGLRNKLATTFAKKDIIESKKYISSGYISIGFVVVVVVIVFLLMFKNANWNQVFNISEYVVSAGALSTSIKIIFVGIMVQFLLRIISSILYALQLSSINNALSLCTAIINLIYISIAASSSNDNNMISMSIVNIIAVNIPLLAATTILFLTKLNDMKPSIKEFSMSYAKQILGLGGMFFLVQIAYMILVNTNEYLISFITDSSYVVDYQIYFKLFTLIGTLTTLALTPIWSAVTKAIAEKKYNWIKKLYKNLYMLGLVSCVIEFAFVIFLQAGVNIWLGVNAITVDYKTAIVFAFLGSFMIMNGVVSSFANGIGKLMPQMICFGIGALVKIPLSFVLVKTLDSWIGIIVSVALALAVYVIVQTVILNNRLKEMC